MRRRVYLEALLVFVVAGCLACGNDPGAATVAGSAGASAAQGGSAAGASASAGDDSVGGASGGGRVPPFCAQKVPESGVQCGGRTCPIREADTAACIVPCCLSVDGQEVCATKSTARGFSSGCALPAPPDPECDQVPQFQGCCDVAQHKCGVLLPLQSGCVTQTNFVTLPAEPKPCGQDQDAGPAPDAG